MSKVTQSGGYPGAFVGKLLDRWWSCCSLTKNVLAPWATMSLASEKDGAI